MAEDYSFRVRVTRCPSDTLNVDRNCLDLNIQVSEHPVYLCSLSAADPIKKSDEWILKSSNWSSARNAEEAAHKYTDALILTLARLRIGVDFGFRALKSVITEVGLRALEQEKGQRVLGEIHGINVYDTNPKPLFASAKAKGLRLVPREKFEKVFLYAVINPIAISQRQRLALELFNSSFFQVSVDTRFLLLVMAIESLLEPSQRSNAAINHVNTLVALTQKCDTLAECDRASMVGTLEWLKRESIGQAGRKLAASRLGNRTYRNMTPEKFFTHCYTLRCRMVHGEMSFPAIEEINSVSGTLEVFVSDILSGQLSEIDLGE